MKKEMKLIAMFIMSVITLAACGGKKQNTENQQTMTDSIVPEEIIEEETVAISPDYLMLNLKGKVKNYKIKGFCWRVLGDNVEFDEAGLVVKIDGKTPKLVRNDKGQIVKYSYKEEDDLGELCDCSKEYQYDENGLLIKMTTYNFYDNWDSVFDRDDEGNIVTWKNISLAEGTIPFKYKYSSFDEQGNWTKLSEGSEVTTRKLTYWE